MNQGARNTRVKRSVKPADTKPVDKPVDTVDNLAMCLIRKE